MDQNLIIRRFGPENKSPVPREGVKGLAAVVIALPEDTGSKFSVEELEKRFNGFPILLQNSTSVVSLYFDHYAHMDEHFASYPILFIVVAGSGFVRVGGPEAEILGVEKGDCLLWPPEVLHRAWTEGDHMEAITISFVN